jgi:hypothetical protein
VDETGQPGGEPAAVNGDGAHGKGVARADENGWRQSDRFAPRPDAERGEAVRSTMSRSGPAHTAEAAWSAGSREPAMEPIPSWRRSAITQLTDDRLDQPRRLSDLLAPVSPPVPPAFPFDGGPEPDGRPTAPEPPSSQATQGPLRNGSTDYSVDRSFPRDGLDGRRPDPYQPDPQHLAAHQPGAYQPQPNPQQWAPPGRPVPEAPPAAHADPFGGFGAYGAAPVAPYDFDDLPTLAEAAAATRGALDADASPEPLSPARPEPGWAHEPSWHRERPWSNGGPLAAPPWSQATPNGSAAVAPRSPAPMNPLPQANPAPPSPVAQPIPAPARPAPAVQSPPVSVNGSPRFDGTAPVSPAVPFHPGPDAMHRMDAAADRAEAAVPRADAPARPEAGPEPDPAGPPPRGPADDDPWADPERRAAAYRESMNGIRAASMGVAAGEARAAADDHAAVQAAYSAAVEAHNTPLGQPSLAGHADRHAEAYHAVPPREQVTPREAVIPRQPGPVDRPVPTGPASAVPATANPEPVSVAPQAGAYPPAGPAARGGARPQPEPPAVRPGPAPQPNPQAPPASAQPPGYASSALPVPPILPQRVPAAPDVPELPDDDLDDDFVDQGPDLAAVNQPELARIATGLRYNEDFEEQPPRPDGFDTLAVLAAVRAVPGVRDAHLRPNPTGGGVHTLRLDLADGADGAQVSRLVARLLKQRMGLAAEPRRVSDARRAAPAQPGPNAGQPHRDANGMPVAGASPTPRVPMPASAAEQLGGPLASVADDRARRRPVPAARGRTLEQDEPHRVIRSATAPRVVIDQVQVSTLGLDATVEVRLTSGGTPAIGVASGPAVDGYVLRLAAVAATAALDQLLGTVDNWDQPGRCFVEHATVVPFGSVDVAVVVVLLVRGSSAEQLTGSALVNGDPRQAVVRATLAAMNRRLDSLLS